ncbi:MAG TPA: acyl-CoA desaturase, partial [Burkholderiales bacterium]
MNPTTPQVRFTGRGAFHAELQQRAQDFFEGSGRSRHGGWRIGAKIAVMLSWLAASWALAVFAPLPAWTLALLAVSIGFAMAGVGFCAMHDANHGATSSSARVNRIVSLSLDLVGASSVLWREKHNVRHHTYTNIAGADPDLEGGSPFLRLAPWQRRRAWHRFQHLYVWLIYAVFPLKWWFFDDLRELSRLRPRDRLSLLAGKGVFLAWAVVIPAMLHPGWGLVALWAIAVATLGNVLAAVFQLAHCMDDAEFVDATAERGDWAEHQLSTTVDFAPRNALLGWYLGGLNFQVEHHLFARVCHVHYPALAAMVRDASARHGLRYR